MAEKAAALSSEVTDLLAQGAPDTEKALEKAAEALAIYKDLSDTAGQTASYRSMISAKVIEGKSVEARKVAQDAVEMLAAAGDPKSQAAAKLLVAEACLATSKNAEAMAAAKEARALCKTARDKEGEADALYMMASAGLDSWDGEAAVAAQDRVAIYKELGDSAKEGTALLLLAEVHVTMIGLKLATCNIPSVDDTMSALKTAKDAHEILVSTNDRDSMESCVGVVARVLLYNGVPSHVIEAARDPEEVYQDVLAGRYSTPANGFPPKPQVKQLKVEEIVPSAKQLERGKFGWTKPTEGYCYTLIWQSVKERNIAAKKARGSYDIMTLNTGTKSMVMPTTFTALSNDAADRTTPLAIFMSPPNTAQQYATSIMSQVSTMAAMITSRLQNMTFVQFNEGQADWTDTRCRQVCMNPVTLSMIRSARLEVPTVNIGFVCGDACSWISDPAPLIENLFDTLESDECEIIWKRNEPFGPLLVHRPMDDGVTYVKAKKTTGMFHS